MNLTLAVLLVSAASITGQAEAPTPVRITGPGYEGAIVSAEAQLRSDPQHMLRPAKVWTPTEADVREAEKRLAAYLDSQEVASVLRGSRIRPELACYKRQYWGVTSGGRREILINFYHESTSVVKESVWLRGIVAVTGGGDQFFRVSYRVQEKRFAGLRINAPE